MKSQTILPHLHSARIALSALFLVDGTAFGIWAGHIPVFKQLLSISDGTLSIALFALVIGSLLSMPVAGHMCARKGSNRVAAVNIGAYCLALALLPLAPSFLMFVASALFFGVARGGVDVAINAQAVTLEHAYARPIMASFQAFWSIGGLCGAGLTSLTLRLEFTAKHSLPVEGILLLCLSTYSSRFLIQEGPTVDETPILSWPTSALLGLGLLAFLALFGEGVMADWSALYLKNSVGVSGSLAAVGYAIYSIAMALGRLCGDWIAQRMASVSILEWSGALTAAGLSLALGIHSCPAALIGFTIVGFGLSNAVPILWGAAAKVSRVGPGAGIAAVTTQGYLGFLIGPPIIGWLSDLVGLRSAMTLVVVLGVAIAILSRHVLPRK
jgi:MFS family permease